MNGPSMRELMGQTYETKANPASAEAVLPSNQKQKPTPGNYHPALQELIDNAPQRLNSDKHTLTFDEERAHDESDFDEGGRGVNFGAIGLAIGLLVAGAALFTITRRYQPAAPADDPNITPMTEYELWQQELREAGHI